PPNGTGIAAQAFPNPAAGGTALRFALSRPGRVTAAVYDVRGRRVRELTATDANAGPQAIAWDGRDGEGRRAPAGAYYARARTPDGDAVARIVLLR
ncbi:T9SS type A sorting domain-containing protein, partial [bacterium]|nr:T9SS type A sorting domain-containing protein [bacterium]